MILGLLIGFGCGIALMAALFMLEGASRCPKCHMERRIRGGSR